MSTAKTRGGSWMSANYDKVVILVVLAILLGSAGTLVALLGGRQQSIDRAAWDKVPERAGQVVGINTGLIASLSVSITSPTQIPSERQHLLVGNLRVACIPNGHPIAYDATNCPVCNSPQPSPGEIKDRDSDGDGMKDGYETAHGFNPLDPLDARADADGDGFSNLEEMQASSNPRDAKSTPSALTKVRVVKTQIDPFKLRFLGIQKLPAGEQYQLNLRSLEKTYFAKQGQIIEGFRVVEVDKANAKKPTLVLKQGEKVIRLVQDEIISEDTFTAFLVSLIDGKQWKVGMNSPLKVGDEEYKVIDIRRDAVVIRDAKNGPEITVPMQSQEESTRTKGDPAGLDTTRRAGALPGGSENGLAP